MMEARAGHPGIGFAHVESQYETLDSRRVWSGGFLWLIKDKAEREEPELTRRSERGRWALTES